MTNLTNSSNLLKIYVENPHLREWYRERINSHNHKLKNNTFPDSGFDLAIPTDTQIGPNTTSCKIDLGIKCTMVSTQCSLPTAPYYIYPRSSISKTPLHLANNVGIIDSGYRGNLIIMIRNFSTDPYDLAKHERIVQLCHHCLLPFYVELVNSETELGTTERMDGGFGSTGK